MVSGLSTYITNSSPLTYAQSPVLQSKQGTFVPLDSIYQSQSMYLFRLHDESKAISAYQTALDKYKGIRWERLSEMRSKPPANLTPSLLRREIEKLKRASTQRDALEAQIQTVSEPQNTAKLYFSLAKSYRILLNFPQVVKTYGQIIQRFPTQKEAVQAQFEMGEVYFKDQIALFDDLHYAPLSDSLKRLAYGEAVEQYQEVAQNYPESEYAPQAMYRIGESYLQMEEYVKAKEVCDGLIEKYPGNPFAAKAKELSSIADSEHRSSLAKKEYGGAYAVVEQFCRAWQNKDYEAMYELLSQEGKIKESKEAFIKRYEGYAAKGGQLVEYTLFLPIAGGDEVVMVRVNINFSKDVPPEMISGVNRFDVSQEERSWRIKRVQLPTLPPPLLGLPGSHPGEN